MRCSVCPSLLSWASAMLGQNRACAPLEILSKNQNFLEPEVSSLILINWFNSCSESLFAGMTLTLHKSQVHCSDGM